MLANLFLIYRVVIFAELRIECGFLLRVGTITELYLQHQNILICLSYIEQREKNVFWSKRREREYSAANMWYVTALHFVFLCVYTCVCACTSQDTQFAEVISTLWVPGIEFRSLGLSTSPLPSEPSRWPCKVLLLFVFYVCIYYY